MTIRRIRAALLLSACVLVSFTSVAGAQDFFPPHTKHYRFLPGRSVLLKTGGFAGVEQRFSVYGTFDFTKTLSPLAVYPPIIIGDFDNVDAWGVHPILDIVEDVDAAFNLSGLEGSTQINGPRNVFRFRGETDDGSSVHLWATTVGPWLYMRGETTPPPGSADFFEYRIKAVARSRPFADFNHDDRVDADDLQVWRQHHGLPYEAVLAGDADGDLKVTGDDFLHWQRQLGELPPSEESLDAALDAAIASIGGAAGAVPEPHAAVLAVLAVGALLTWRRRA
jgi:MYXO-CTERM domain-containing protein